MSEPLPLIVKTNKYKIISEIAAYLWRRALARRAAIGSWRGLGLPKN